MCVHVRAYIHIPAAGVQSERLQHEKHVCEYILYAKETYYIYKETYYIRTRDLLYTNNMCVCEYISTYTHKCMHIRYTYTIYALHERRMQARIASWRASYTRIRLIYTYTIYALHERRMQARIASWRASYTHAKTHTQYTHKYTHRRIAS